MSSIENILAQISGIIFGKEQQIRLSLACLIARGHLLIEDLPGVGKTTLAHAFSRSLGLDFHWIQFTSDLLPADILGISTFDRQSGAFNFHPGPIFSQIVLADEINRATPKTQSALLEAMEERHVSIEGETRPLPTPFFVIATQNPVEQAGTFPLPESQLDRFLMRIRLGYPDRGAERQLLLGISRKELISELRPCIEKGELLQLQEKAKTVHTSAALIDYLQALIHFSRVSRSFAYGLSPRAGLALLASARAWALMEGREEVLPEDVQAVLPSVVNHRLTRIDGSQAEPAEELITAVPIP